MPWFRLQLCFSDVASCHLSALILSLTLVLSSPLLSSLIFFLVHTVLNRVLYKCNVARSGSQIAFSSVMLWCCQSISSIIPLLCGFQERSKSNAVQSKEQMSASYAGRNVGSESLPYREYIVVGKPLTHCNAVFIRNAPNDFCCLVLIT